jgi:Isochorismatase family
VRATVVDAFSLNYRVILAKKGCFARNEASHAVNLCDMHAKSAEVVSTAEILSYLTSTDIPRMYGVVSHGLPFPLPSQRNSSTTGVVGGRTGGFPVWERWNSLLSFLKAHFSRRPRSHSIPSRSHAGTGTPAAGR